MKLKLQKKGVPGGPEIPGFPGGCKFREISGKFVQICQNRGFFDQKFSYRHVATAGKPRNDPPEISVFEKTQKNGIFRYFSIFFGNFQKFSKTLLGNEGTKFPENFTFFFFVIFRDFRKLKIYNIYKSLQRENIEKTSKFWRFFFEKFSEIFRFFSEFSEKFS